MERTVFYFVVVDAHAAVDVYCCFWVAVVVAAAIVLLLFLLLCCCCCCCCCVVVIAAAAVVVAVVLLLQLFLLQLLRFAFVAYSTQTIETEQINLLGKKCETVTLFQDHNKVLLLGLLSLPLLCDCGRKRRRRIRHAARPKRRSEGGHDAIRS